MEIHSCREFNVARLVFAVMEASMPSWTSGALFSVGHAATLAADVLRRALIMTFGTRLLLHTLARVVRLDAMTVAGLLSDEAGHF